VSNSHDVAAVRDGGDGDADNSNSKMRKAPVKSPLSTYHHSFFCRTDVFPVKALKTSLQNTLCRFELSRNIVLHFPAFYTTTL